MKKIAFVLLFLMVDVGYGQQATPLAVTVDFPQIAMGGDGDGLNYATLLQIVNMPMMLGGRLYSRAISTPSLTWPAMIR